MSLPDPDHQPEFYDGVLAKRLVAWLIDAVIITGLTLVFGILSFGIGLFLFFAVYGIVEFLYRLMSLTSGSATWGMRFAGIELRQRDGTRLDLGTAFLHTAGYLAALMVFPAQLVSMVLMMLSDRGQGLVDLVLGTAMVNRRAAAYLT